MTLAVYPGMQALVAADFCGSSSLVATLLPGFAWMKHRQRKSFAQEIQAEQRKNQLQTKYQTTYIYNSKNLH
jgi:cell division protein FtsL